MDSIDMIESLASGLRRHAQDLRNAEEQESKEWQPNHELMYALRRLSPTLEYGLFLPPGMARTSKSPRIGGRAGRVEGIYTVMKNQTIDGLVELIREQWRHDDVWISTRMPEGFPSIITRGLGTLHDEDLSERSFVLSYEEMNTKEKRKFYDALIG